MGFYAKDAGRGAQHANRKHAQNESLFKEQPKNLVRRHRRNTILKLRRFESSMVVKVALMPGAGCVVEIIYPHIDSELREASQGTATRACASVCPPPPPGI